MENNQGKIILLKDLGLLKQTEQSNYKARFGLFKCFYGKEFKTRIKKDFTTSTKSCGCLSFSNSSIKIMHGQSNTRLYKIYHKMISRCTNLNHKHYSYYGGKGVKVCEEWLKDFNLFKKWSLDNGYKDNLTIDRKENCGDYTPTNCRWTTRSVQARNTKMIFITNTSGYRGVALTNNKKRYRSYISVNRKQINLGVFDTAIEAGMAYNEYVINNGLEHTLNNIGN